MICAATPDLVEASRHCNRCGADGCAREVTSRANGTADLRIQGFNGIRGVDQPADLWRIIEKRDQGTAVLLVSTELDEIRALSDRIAVMFEGKIVDILPANRVTKEQLGLLMAGSRPEDLDTEAEGEGVEADVEAVL